TVKVLEGHTDLVTCCAYSQDGKLLFSASRVKTIRIWDLTLEQRLDFSNRHWDVVMFCIYAPNGKQLASACKDGTIRLWDAATGKTVKVLGAGRRFDPSTGHEGEVNFCMYSPDGKTLASASQDNTVHRSDIETGKALQSSEGHMEAVTSCAYSPN